MGLQKGKNEKTQTKEYNSQFVSLLDAVYMILFENSYFNEIPAFTGMTNKQEKA